MAEYVDLSERITATFYDDEREEWSERNTTVKDVLDGVCDAYTVLSSEDIRKNRSGQWLHVMDGPEGECWECSECGEQWIFEEGRTPYDEEVYFCPNRGADMRPRSGENNG